MSSPNENACHCPDRPIVEGPDQRPQNPPPYCVAEPNHPPPPNPPPPKKPHWGATCLTCVGMRSLAYRRCRSREAVFFKGASSSRRLFLACRLPPGSKRAIVVSMILPLASMRKHSEIVIAPRRLTSPESASTDVHERSRLASDEGGASAVLGATSFHTARMTGSKIGTATPPPVAPPPSVRRLPFALSYPIHTATVTSLVKPTNQASFSSSEVPVLPAT